MAAIAAAGAEGCATSMRRIVRHIDGDVLLGVVPRTMRQTDADFVGRLRRSRPRRLWTQVFEAVFRPDAVWRSCLV